MLFDLLDRPKADALVDASGGKLGAVGTKGDGADFLGVAEEGSEQFAGVDVPEPERLVVVLPVASVLPSGLNATQVTVWVWPVKVCRSVCERS